MLIVYNIGKPFFGNLLDIPKSHSWLRFKEWADEYGPIFRFNIAGRENIVVSTEKIANDLLRERGTLYSSREHLPMAGGILSDNLRPLLLPYNGSASTNKFHQSQLTWLSIDRFMATRPKTHASSHNDEHGKLLSTSTVS
jgi:hypothetical protein